jgi:ribosomal protein S18 acetylase RimI-like enzyme
VSDTRGSRGIEVRRVRADEWEELRDTRLRALADAPDAFATTHAEACARPEQWWRDWARRSAEGAEQAMFLAWLEGKPIGIAGAFRTGGRIDVIAMWTSPEQRGEGVGRALLDAAVAFAGEAEVHLGVTETNAGARRFYERYGFVPTGVTEPLRPNSHLRVHGLVLRR